MNEQLREEIVDGFGNTELGFLRIRRNLGVTHLSDQETEAYLRELLQSTLLSDIEKRGKNYYFSNTAEDAVLTVNSYNYTIITAKKLSKVKQ